MTGKHWRLALMLTLALGLGTAVLLLGRPAQSAPVQGYLVRLEVFEDHELMRTARMAQPANNFAGQVNTPAALAQIAGWAGEQGLSYFAPASGNLFKSDAPPSDVVVRNLGIGLEIHIYDTDRAKLDSLLARLADLPGMTPSLVLSGQTIEVGDYQMLAPTLDVRINGRPYRSPDDFTANEQQSLFGPLTNGMMGLSDSSYYAFFTLDHRVPDRFDLGDIVRVHWDGSLLSIDTLVEDWGLSVEQITQVLDAPNRAWGMSGPGATRIEGDYSATGTIYAAFFLPHGMDEADLDVRAEFERRLNPLPQDIHEPRYSVTLLYDLIAPEQLQTRRATELAAYPLPEQAAAEAQVRLDAWLAEHPEYRRGLAFSQPVKLLKHPKGELLTRLRLSMQTDDPALADELEALLADIEGLPEPRVTVRDRDEER